MQGPSSDILVLLLILPVFPLFLVLVLPSFMLILPLVSMLILPLPLTFIALQ